MEQKTVDRFTVDGVDCPGSLRTPVIDQMARHVSVRAFDPDRALPEGLVPVLISAAQSASTSSNFQSWSVVVITDPERKRTMRQFCADQAFIDEAPLFLAFCADASRHRWVTARQGYKFGSDYLDLLLVAAVDSALACQNASLAAESLGLGCCMVGSIRNKAREVAEFLKLPRGVFATVGLAVGHPAHKNAVKPRLPHSVILHHEAYSTDGLEAGVAAYDETMMQTDIYSGRRLKIPGVTPEPDTVPYHWSEHTARRMAGGNDLRRGLGQFLRDQGFVLE